MKRKNIFLLNAIIFPLLLTACSNSDCPPCVDNFSDGYTSGYQNGESDGYSDGYQDGYSEGYGEGKEDGTSEGYSDGYQDGYSDGYEDGEEAGSTSEEVDITISEALYDIHTEEQYAYLTGNSLDVGGHITGLEEKSKPVPVVITGSRDNRYQTKDVNKYILKLSKSQEMEQCVEYTNTIDKFTLSNLNIATRYFYTITAVTNSESFTSAVKSFSVKGQAPRNLDIDGVTNCRDLGGWLIEGTERRTAQNLFFRTAKLHDDVVVNITEKGKEEIKRLGIKTEIDLRDPTSSYLKTLVSPVEGVNYYNCGMDGEKSYINNDLNREGIKKTFLVLSDVNNYPLLFHCAIGTDRTGFIAFLINCLAGVSLDDMCRDYVFSSFASINGIRNSNTIKEYARILNADYSANNNYSIGATNLLKSLGLTTGQINVVKEMITNGYLVTDHHASTNWSVSSIDPDVYHEKICTDADCGVVIHKEKHEFSDLIIDEAPSITKDGVGHHSCLICGHEKEEIIPKTGQSFSYAGIHSYGNATTFTIRTTAKLSNINGTLTDLKLYKDDKALEGVTYTYSKGDEYSTIQFNLASALNSGDVVTVKQNSILSDGTTNLVLDEDIHFTYNGSGFYPSFLKNPIPACRTGSDGEQNIEFYADFTDFIGGEAKESLQPYYTARKGSNFTYTIIRNDQVIKTYVNDCVNGEHNGEIITSMFWISAKLLRIELQKFRLEDGDIFCLKKGSVYADNGYHEGGSQDVRKYILHEDIRVRYISETESFEKVDY